MRYVAQEFVTSLSCPHTAVAGEWAVHGVVLFVLGKSKKSKKILYITKMFVIAASMGSREV